MSNHRFECEVRELNNKVDKFLNEDGACLLEHQQIMEYRISALMEILIGKPVIWVIGFFILPAKLREKITNKIIARMVKEDLKELGEAKHFKDVAKMEAARKAKNERPVGDGRKLSIVKKAGELPEIRVN